MKIGRTSASLAALIIAGILATSGALAMARNNDRTQADQPRYGDTGSGTKSSTQPMSSKPGSGLLSSQLMKQKVFDQQGKEIGHVTELIVDPSSGRISHAVVSYGQGFMGIGNKEVLVPWNSLQTAAAASGERAPQFTIQEANLRNAPEFKRSEWDTSSRTARLQNFSGTITKVDDSATAGAGALQVRTDEGVMNVDLGSKWDQQKGQLSLKEGDSIQIKGYYSGFGAQRRIVAQELTANGKTVTLDTTDRPYRETGEELPGQTNQPPRSSTPGSSTPGAGGSGSGTM